MVLLLFAPIANTPIRINKNTNPKSISFGKYFARTAKRGTVGIEELCEHIASHGSSFDRATIQGVVITLVDCIYNPQNEAFRLFGTKRMIF